MYFETTHNFFEPANISDIAASLYGGGWRAEDRDDLISEYVSQIARLTRYALSWRHTTRTRTQSDAGVIRR